MNLRKSTFALILFFLFSSFCFSTSSSSLSIISTPGFLLTSLSSSPIISTRDLQTLLEFKKTADPNNATLTSWNESSPDPCHTWVGVECRFDGRVEALRLEKFNLTGSIGILSELTGLRSLLLGYNNLTIPSNFSLSSWKNMQYLVLSNNNFSSSFPSGVSALQRLFYIDLSHNRFHGEIPMPMLIRLPRLRKIRLGWNCFSGSLQDSTWSTSKNFFKFMEFDVSRNNLSGEIPEVFSSFHVSWFTGNDNLCGKPLAARCCSEKTSNSVSCTQGVVQDEVIEDADTMSAEVEKMRDAVIAWRLTLHRKDILNSN